MRALAGKTVAAILVAFAVVVIAQLAGSEPVRKKILDELDVHEGDRVITLRISLTSPVRYVWHFPNEAGEELRIKITLFDVSSDNRDALPGRETLVPSGGESVPLNEGVYEGDIEGGPYLTLFFTRRVDFRVEQGTDSRSIVVHISKPDTEQSAEPPREPDEE